MNSSCVTNTNKRNIIIDCDPGHDDAIAIMMAVANPEIFNILAITTVGGNQLLDRVTDNALKILSFLDVDIPVAAGEALPLIREIHTGGDAHGESGMDGPLLPKSKFKTVEEHAVKFMYDLIMKQDQKTTLVPIGPLTNIALLIKTYPHVKSKIELISLMGGGINLGNRSAAAEFNIYVDPEAAKIVYDSEIPIVMSGLDVTNDAQIFSDEYEAIRNNGLVSKLVAELLDFYGIAGKRFGFEGCCLHDPCAIAYLINPDLFDGKYYHVDVETEGRITRGMTLADKRPVPDKKPNTFVLEGVKREKLVALVIDCLDTLDKSRSTI